MSPYSVRRAYVPWLVVAIPAVVMLVWAASAAETRDSGSVVRMAVSAVALALLVIATATARVGLAVVGTVLLIALFPFRSPGGGAAFFVQVLVLVLLGVALVAVRRRRRRRNGRSWVEFTQRAEAAGYRCFVVGFAKPNGAQTIVNGHDLERIAQPSRNTSVWGHVPAGVTVALDAGRRVEGWVPTSCSHDAAAVSRYRWHWW